MKKFDDTKRRVKTGAKRVLARPLAMRREEQALVLIATITLSSIGGIGVAQAKGGYYEIDVAGQSVGYVKNPKNVEAAISLAKEDYHKKTGKTAVRPVITPEVEKRGVSDKEKPLQMHELADKLSNEVEWVVLTPAIVLPDGTTLAVEDEKTAKLILTEIVQEAEARSMENMPNQMEAPRPKLENADAELSDLALLSDEQLPLEDTTFALGHTDIYDKVKVEDAEVNESEVLTKDEALAQIKKGRMMPHNHVLSEGEDSQKVAELWQITPERVNELNPELLSGPLNPGMKITVERLEPLIRDHQIITEVRQEYTPFEVSYLDDPELMIGEYKVETPGKAGVKTVTATVERVAGFEQSRTVEEEIYNRAPENAIVRRGTAETPGVAWPLEGVLTSPFGERTWANGFSEFHRGIDIAAPSGMPVKAAKSGIITYAAEMGSYGNVVFINHGDGLSTRYAHLSEINCEVGDEVRMGDVIGLVGSTGNSTGPHLHFETLIDGSPKNPMHFLKDGKDNRTYDPAEDYDAYMRAHGHRTVSQKDNTIVVTDQNGKEESITVTAPKDAEVTVPSKAETPTPVAPEKQESGFFADVFENSAKDDMNASEVPEKAENAPSDQKEGAVEEKDKESGKAEKALPVEKESKKDEEKSA